VVALREKSGQSLLVGNSRLTVPERSRRFASRKESAVKTLVFGFVLHYLWKRCIVLRQRRSRRNQARDPALSLSFRTPLVTFILNGCTGHAPEPALLHEPSFVIPCEEVPRFALRSAIGGSCRMRTIRFSEAGLGESDEGPSKWGRPAVDAIRDRLFPGLDGVAGGNRRGRCVAPREVPGVQIRKESPYTACHDQECHF